MGLARRIDLSIQYENVDISTDISPYIESIGFCDNASGEADDFSLTLEDRKGLWQGDWYPEKGAKIDVDLVAINWTKDESQIKIPCGKMEIDEVESSGPPKKFQMKAVSVYCSGEIRETRTKGWEGVTLKQIATDIANNEAKVRAKSA